MSAFDRIFGYEEVKEELYRLCDVFKNPEIYREMHVTIPQGLLLYGDPGLGKTTMAECFIEETGCDSYTIRKNKSDGYFIDEIRRTFEKAREKTSCIVLLDDLDKYANNDEDHKDAEEYAAVQACIDASKDCGVFVIATANDIDNLPDSLLRKGRFSNIIKLHAPKRDDARKIIANYFWEKRVTEDVDLEEIVRILDGYSCAVLESIFNEAGIYAGRDGRNRIEQKDIIKACMRVLYDAPEALTEKAEKTLHYAAVHEAGHAVIGEILNPGSINLASVCNYSGETGGVVSAHSADDCGVSFTSRENEIIRILGGKAATEVVFGMADIGCDNDLHRAFWRIDDLVTDNCTFGFVYIDISNPSQYSLECRDRAITKAMESYYDRAKSILIENRDFLDALTDALIRKTTLTYKDINNIREMSKAKSRSETGAHSIG